MLGSLGVITGKDMRGDRHLPFWLEQGIESSLRDTEEDIPVVSFTATSSSQAQRSLGTSHVESPTILTLTEGTSPEGPMTRGGKDAWMNLDKFYADDGSEESDTEDSNEGQDDNIEQDDEDEDDMEGDDESDGEKQREDPRYH